MDTGKLSAITETKRLPSPAVTPQALAFHHGMLWMGSRDLRRIYEIDPKTWAVLEERDAPGIPWAMTCAGDDLRVTLGEGAEDDRYLRRYRPRRGFVKADRIACPEFTGSYLSCDGRNLYLSQWYKHRILKLDEAGQILREYAVGAEICGHTFVGDWLHVIRGTEQGDEDWRLSRFDPRLETIEIEDLARVPFQCRSLAHDGGQFWTNHRSAHEIVAFDLPAR